MAVMNTKIAKAKCMKDKNLTIDSKPSVRVLVRTFTCLVITKAKIIYIPKTINERILIKIQKLKPVDKKYSIFSARLLSNHPKFQQLSQDQALFQKKVLGFLLLFVSKRCQN